MVSKRRPRTVGFSLANVLPVLLVGSMPTHHLRLWISIAPTFCLNNNVIQIDEMKGGKQPLKIPSRLVGKSNSAAPLQKA